jgi:hypothetical protein
MYARAFNSEHQLDLLNELCARLCEDKQYRLVVVDSIMVSHFFHLRLYSEPILVVEENWQIVNNGLGKC